MGPFWERVDIGITNNKWKDTVNDYRYSGTRTYQLSSSGTYRVTVIYKALFYDLCKHGKWHKIQNGNRAGKSQGCLLPIIAY